ncbi:plastocyanin/azurin family copper-binding protein [Halorubellus litoreus]|uniref:Plastocyanin/azurin family copper-binding protein n=1 Tax=Halorubellus litoreus TaxID=755308 RepID=A0ABD5VH31_9EURY
MQQPEQHTQSRRNVLKTAGIATVALLALPGAAAAKTTPKGNGYGNGNGIGAFLNAPAEFKNSPVWTGGIENHKRESTVTVTVGAMTDVDVPNVPIPSAPVAFAPQAIVVSPGTTVVWTWPTYEEPVAGIPHDVVALDGSFDSGLQFPETATDFSHTFEERGTYLYYCTPHGAPFPVESFLGFEVLNEFGMRGAVVVA